jgi:rfaE bifunctional protein nucleotidyltransferase chain/domain
LLSSADVELLALPTTGSTVEKMRVRVDDRCLLRLDRGEPGGELGAVPPAALDAISDADAILVADYGHHVTCHPQLRRLIEQAGAPVVWDPHPRGAAPVPGATLVTPNRRESEQFARTVPDHSPGGASALRTGLSGVATCAHRLRAAWGARAVAITLGSHGALVVEDDGPPLVVPVDRPVVGGDTCGAGDAFASSAAVELAGGGTPAAAVVRAVAAASAFVAAGGAGAPAGDPGHRMGRAERSDEEILADRIARVRERGGTVVATGGCFDVLHPGHVSTLQRARALGDYLVVLLNSDASVRRLKGPTRPAQHHGDRAAVLRSLACVDDVVVFDDDVPVAALRELRPHIFVKGGDYAFTSIPEADLMATWGGVVVTVPFVSGRSTTRIVERLMAPPPLTGTDLTATATWRSQRVG